MRQGLAITAALLFLVAGCGSGTAATEETSAPPPVLTSAVVSPPVGATTVVADPSPVSSSPVTPETSATESSLPTGADPPAPCPGVRCVSVVVTGDVLLHEPLWQQAVDDGGPGPAMNFGPLLSGQMPYVQSADLAICHLETPVAAADGPYQGYPNFVVPPQILTGLVTTGYDACTTASNHSNDDGTGGINRTLDALDAAGLAHAGTARSAEEATAPTLLQAKGGVVGLVSATYDLNGASTEEPWQTDLIDPQAILAEAAAAKAAGADVVVVALHAGVEYQHEPTTQQQELAQALLADPAVDLVYGHHAHVVQPLEEVNGKWVVYGLGNTVAAHAVEDLANREGLLVRVQFAQQEDGSWITGDIAWVPSLVHDQAPYRWCSLIAGQVCSTPDDDRISLDRITEVVNSRGAVEAGAYRLPS